MTHPIQEDQSSRRFWRVFCNYRQLTPDEQRQLDTMLEALVADKAILPE